MQKITQIILTKIIQNIYLASVFLQKLQMDPYIYINKKK